MISATTTTEGSGGWLIWWGTSIISGFGWWLVVLVTIYVIAAPVLYFHPLIWDVLAYIVEGVIALAAIAGLWARRSARKRGI
ncbi:MAG: hypothetical protein ACREN1_00270 [Candidatus Dormibacteria bacterium]